MAGRYPHNRDTDPASMSPASASTPISYRANVNRQKTKKWAEAKPADYGGDDWGDDDDGYDLPPPPPVSKPTGLRQAGQALNSAPNPEPPPAEAKKSHGDLPPLPSSATTSRPRVNSFDADDEKRNFRSGLAREPSPQLAATKAPSTRFSQITGVPSARSPVSHPALSLSTQPSTQQAVTGLRKAIPTPPPSGPAAPDAPQLGRTSTGDSSSIASYTLNPGTPSNYQAQRDFSPSALPPPLQTRSSPEPLAIRLPASGSSQALSSDSSETTKGPQEMSAQKPWAAAQPASPSASAPSTQGKALPFIRPADIYRRMEEAREKERRSIESSRHSMDSITGPKSGDRSESPTQPLPEPKQTSELVGRNGTDFENDDAFDPGRLKTTLEPVRERKSEYGFDGFQLNDPSGADNLDSPDYTAQDKLGADIERQQSTSPQLPNLSRMSGFGMDFLSQTKSDNIGKPSSLPSETTPTGPPKEFPEPAEEHTLRNEPSLGFKSAVNQAFDRADQVSESSLPPTPASQTDTGIKRSESESTSTTGISPIMSRLPSAAMPGSKNTYTAHSPPVVIESSSMAPVKESSEVQEPSEHASNIGIFKPGHRRDISTPSPGNSPARTPDLTKSQTLSSGQQAVITEPFQTLASGTMGSGPDQTIRPSLPGGWSSSEVAQALEPSAVFPEPNEKYDIMPAATKRSQPQSSLEAAVLGASLSNVTVAAVSKPEAREVPTPVAKDKESPLPAPKDDPLEPSVKAHVVPTLTMDSPSIDGQSDKLHEDTVDIANRQLEAAAQVDSLMPENAEDQASFNQARISSYLPSEYENYWAASAEEEMPAPLASVALKDAAKEAEVAEHTPATVAEPVPKSEPELVQPLTFQKPEQIPSSLVSPVSRRYSWEADDGLIAAVGQGESHLPLGPSQADRDIGLSTESNEKLMRPTVVDDESHAEGPTTDHTEGNMVLAAGSMALAGSVGAPYALRTDSETQPGQPLSSIDEDDHAPSPHPMLLVSTESDQQDMSLQAQLPLTLDQLSSRSAARSTSPVASSKSAPAAKIPTFKEIAAIDSIKRRIQTFDETRQRFAFMDSGLSNWMETLKSQFPEHASVSGSYAASRTSVPSGSAPSKYAGNIPGQQPYYQQYLDANSPAVSGAPAARPGSAAQSSSQQGFSPASGSKISTQQVQAKGKELLHSAGIFGGKAGKAGKGLLAKGKSRLRGGGDKTPGSHYSKADRRSSWGLPNSSSRSNPPSRHSGEESPTGTSQRRRASTLTLDTHPAQPRRPSASDVMSAPGNLIAPWTTLESFPPGQSIEPPPMPKLPPMLKPVEAPDDDEPESTDDSDDDAPAGSGQPSSNVFDALPAPVQEHSHGQSRQAQPSYMMQAAASPPKLTASSAPVTQNNLSKRKGSIPDTYDKVSESEQAQISSKIETDSRQQNLTMKDLPPNPEPKGMKSPSENLMVPSSTGKTRNRGNSSTSILDRPRYSYDIPRPGEQASQPQMDKPLPSVYFPSLIDAGHRSLVVNHAEEESKSENSFEGLPPLRRISGIGFDFNPRDSNTVSSDDGDDHEIEEEREEEHDQENGHEEEDPAEEEEDIDPFHALRHHSYSEDSQAEIFAALRAAAGMNNDDPNMGGQRPGAALTRPQPQTPLRQLGSTRPPVPYAVSPMHSLDPLRLQREQKGAVNSGIRPDIATNGDNNFPKSEDVWVPPPFASPGDASDVTISPHRFSLGGGPGTHVPTHGPTSPRKESQEERAWRNSWTPQQPPSSAQRYPGPFRPQVPVSAGAPDEDDLPPQYFQSAIPQVSAFIPRQQATGVGFLPDSDGSERNSAFAKETGEGIRGSSRDSGKPASRDGAPPTSKNTATTRDYNDTDSSIGSDDGRDQNRRNSFFAGFNRASTAAGSAHESMVAHPAASRHDLPLSTQSSPTTPNDRKKAGFKNSSPAEPVPPVPPLPKPNRLAVLAASGPSEEPGKKKRFSGLSSMFGKSSNHGSKGSISESSRERHSVEPPPEALLPKQAQILGTGLHSNPRTFLSKLTAGGEQPAHTRQDSKNLKSKLGIGAESSQPRRETKTRKPGAGLLTGIIGKRPTQQEQPEETTSIRSKIGPPIYHPPAFLLARSNSNLGGQSKPTQKPQPPLPSSPQSTQQADLERERGRRMSRERQYPTVPIPNGYTLVRGEGATPVRTEYDPRGFNLVQQTDPRYAQGGRQNAGPSTQDLSLSQGSRSPNLTIESSEGSQLRDPRRLSREDMLARSPARSPEGQQRPYQLSLPGDKEDGEPRPAPMGNDVPIISPPRKVRNSVVPLSSPETAQVAIIQRLVHPVLRHPQFPAGYPLPDDDVFSPVNSSARDIPAPAAPKWPEQKDRPEPNSTLQRGNKAQVVLGLSRRPRAHSKPLREEDVLAAPDALQKEMGARLEITPSPSPPSVGTPLSRREQGDPDGSRESSNKASSDREGMHIPIPEPKPSPDLYNASPRLPKLATSPNNDSSISIGKDDKEVMEEEAVRRGSRSSAHPAELDDPESEMLKRARGKGEEKIPAQENLLDVEDHEPVMMSATSYPGQEWNPYAGGVYEDYLD